MSAFDAFRIFTGVDASAGDEAREVSLQPSVSSRLGIFLAYGRVSEGDEPADLRLANSTR
jgi:hypothetical protein